MCGYAGAVWCGAGAPVVQGIIVGFCAASIGLVVFPFTVEPQRPERGPLSGFATAVTSARWGRRLSWLLGLLTLAALAGYEVMFVRARGKFCDATLDATARTTACWWIWEVAATVLAFAALATLRRRTRRAPDSSRGAPMP